MQICIQSFNQTLQKSHIWLKQLTEIGGFKSEEEAYSALRAVLHCLRDRLQTSGAAHLAAQLPMLIRGMYYDGWKPTLVPEKIRTQEHFIEHIKDSLGNAKNTIDITVAVPAVFQLLNSNISRGEIDHIRSLLPNSILKLWPQP